MFGIKSAPKKHQVVLESVDTEFENEYNSLASGLGVQCRKVGTRRKLLQFLHDSNIEVYDLGKVEKYMDKKGHWGWFPLRDVDQPKDGKVWILQRATTTRYSSLYGSSENSVYDKPVPYPVLLTVKTIQDAFPESGLVFLVGALNDKPDPFLACRLQDDLDRTVIVIERWDEPSFRG